MWKQTGFVVISEAIDGDQVTPIVHGFETTEWRALAKEAEIKSYPEELRVGLRVVLAILRFEM